MIYHYGLREVGVRIKCKCRCSVDFTLGRCSFTGIRSSVDKKRILKIDEKLTVFGMVFTTEVIIN